MAKDTKKAVDETIGAFKRLREEIKQYKDELTELQRENKQGTEEWAQKAQQLAKAQKDLDTVQKVAKGNLAAYNVEQVKSINDLKEKIKLLNQERNAMDMSSKEYAEATKELKVLNDQLREAGTSAGDWRSNVGNYANSIREAFGDLSTAATSLGGSLGGLNAGMLKLASNPAGAAIMALVGTIKFLAEGIKSSEENTNKWNEAMVPVKTVIVMITKAAQEAASKFADWVIALRQNETAINVVKTALKAFLTIVEDTKTRISNLKEALSTVGKGFETAFGKAKDWVSGVAEKMPNLTTKLGDVGTAIKDKIHKAVTDLIGLNDKIASSWIGKLLGMKTSEQIKEIGNAAQETTDKVTDMFTETEEQVDRATKASNALAATLRGLGHQAAKLGVEIKGLAADYAEALEEQDYERAQDILDKKLEKEEQLAKTQVAIASAQLDVIRKQNALSKSGTADLNAEAQAMDAVIAAEGGLKDALRERAQQQKALNKLINAKAEKERTEKFKEAVSELNKELNSLTNTYNKALNSLSKPLKPETGDTTKDTLNAYYDEVNANAQAEYDAYVKLMDSKIEKLEEFIERERAAGNDVRKQEEDLAKFREEQADGYLAKQKQMNQIIEQSNKDRKKSQDALIKSQLKGYEDLFSSVSELFEQDTYAYKATATAKALIATYLAANDALANTPGGAIAKGVAMAATLAAGLANVISIWKVNPSGENGVSSSSAPTIAEPAVQETNPYSYTRQVQTYQEADELNRPLWISVVDIDRAQERVRIVENESTF